MFPRSLWDVVLPLLEDLDTPRSLTVKLLIEHGELDQLARLALVPAHYCSPDKLFRDSVATSLLRKCRDLETGIDTEQEAMKVFSAAEKQCFVTNARLAPYIAFPNGPMSAGEWRIADFLRSVKQSVGGILGRLPDDLTSARHGPGATFHDVGAKTTAPDKMSSRPTRTPEAGAFEPLWVETAWFRALAKEFPDRSAPLEVRGNRFTTVPKDATTDRGIAIEPSLNVYFQLGVGACLRSRLRKAGIDLDDGQSLHRRLACESSRSTQGHLATIDLSSASDTVCKNLVKLMLPDGWFGVLNSLRSPTTIVEGKTHLLQKFSSMGNGFTFELETLLFFVISSQVLRSRGVCPIPGVNIHVYGDDIIVPSECAADVMSALRYFGFTPNMKKTFSSGVFRESCGGDFFDGVAVRGHFQKFYPSEPHHWISFANGLRRVFIDHGGVHFFESVGRRAWLRILANLPSKIRNLRGPSALGDILVHDVSEKWRFIVRNSIRKFQVWTPVLKPLPLNRWRPLVQLACALYGVPSVGPFQRGRVAGYRFGYVPWS